MSRLTSFKEPVRAIVIGASGGIGGALIGHLLQEETVEAVAGWSRRDPGIADPRFSHRAVDIADEQMIADAVEAFDGANLCIVATGLLHDGDGSTPEKSWRALDAATLARSFLVNTIGPALIAKHVLPRFDRDRRAVFAALSARVGSISDNRLGGWYGYRASKAALNQVLRTLAIELARKHPHALCVGLHPGTVDTGLSRPFQGGVADDALFDAATSAGHLLDVLDGLTAADSGGIFAWDGAEITP